MRKIDWGLLLESEVASDLLLNSAELLLAGFPDSALVNCNLKLKIECLHSIVTYTSDSSGFIASMGQYVGIPATVGGGKTVAQLRTHPTNDHG